MKQRKKYESHSDIRTIHFPKDTCESIRRTLVNIVESEFKSLPRTRKYRKIKKAYYEDMVRFIQHLVSCTLDSKSVPIPHDLGHNKMELMFLPKYKGLARGFDTLIRLGYVTMETYSHKNHRCRKFRLTNKSIVKFRYTFDNREAVKSLPDRFNIYNYCCSERTNRIEFNKLILNKKQHKLEHDISVVERFGSVKSVELVKSALSRFQGMTIYFNSLIDLMHALNNKSNSIIRKLKDSSGLQFEYYIQRLREIDIELKAISAFADHCAKYKTSTNYKKMYVVYYPKFKIAEVGSRFFEIGSGYQGLKKNLKPLALKNVTNYDIMNSQFTTLRMYFDRYGIVSKFLDTFEDIDQVVKTIKIKRPLVKTILYSAIFNNGLVSKEEDSDTYNAVYASIYKRELKKLKDNERLTIDYLEDKVGKEANDTVDRWNAFIKHHGFNKDIQKLSSILLKECLDKKYVNNDLGVKLPIRVFEELVKVQNSKKKENKERKRSRYTLGSDPFLYSSIKLKRKILAHKFQAVEVKLMLKLILRKQNKVFMHEHDGVVAILSNMELNGYHRLKAEDF